MKRWHIKAYGITLTAALLIAVILVTENRQPASGGGGSQEATAGGGSAERVDGPAIVPHCGGQRTSLVAEAASAAYTVLVPDTPIASTANLTATYDCGVGATRLEFSSGVSITFGLSNVTDPAKTWERLAATAPDIYSTATVRGVPAWLSDPAKDPTGVADGGVVFILPSHTRVAVIGNEEIPLDDLISVAESLQPIGISPSPSVSSST
jgi:hypothetical protein